MPVSKRRSRRTRPQRSNAGIILPEYVFFGALRSMQEQLGKGIYGYDSIEETFLESFPGLSLDAVEQVFSHLKKTPPRVSLSFPRDRAQLPHITIMPEEQTPEKGVIGHHGGIVDEDLVTTDDQVLTPSGGAVGGETTFKLPHSGIIVGSVVLSITRGADTIPLYRVPGDFTVDGEGAITLGNDFVAGLVAGDILTADSYTSYGLPSGTRYTSMESFTHVLLIDTINPIVTAALYGIVWRELMVKKDAIQDVGLTDLTISRRSQSLWDQIQPAFGYRTEMVVSGLTEWTVYQRAYQDVDQPPRTVNVDMDTTGGDESIVLLSMDIEDIGIDPFDG